MTYVPEWSFDYGMSKEPILWRCECGARMAYFLLRCQACRRDKPTKGRDR